MPAKLEKAVPTNRSVFPFFGLPRELRDQIYDELWKFTPSITLKHGGLTLQLQYNGHHHHGEDQHLPIWLLTDKKMLKEGIDQFHCKDTCVWDKEFRLRSTTPESSLLFPSAFRDITIKYFYLAWTSDVKFDDQNQDYHDLEILDMGHRYSKSLQQLGRLIHGSCFRVLRLHFMITFLRPITRGNISWAVDLSPMLQFPAQLEEMEVVVHVPRETSRYTDMALFNRDITPLLKQEIARVGNLLIGGKAKLKITENTCGEISELDGVQNEWRFKFVKENTE